MGFIFILVIVLVIAGIVFINIKISDLKYRAGQQLLKNTGLNNSEINAGIRGGFEQKHLENFLNEHPNYTEETIKDLLKQYGTQIIQKNQIETFSQEVCEKMQQDTKIEKMQDMKLERVNIIRYSNPKLNAIVVYTDEKDEYELYLTCNILEGKIQLEKYQISKGMAVGL